MFFDIIAFLILLKGFMTALQAHMAEYMFYSFTLFQVFSDINLLLFGFLLLLQYSPLFFQG